VFDGADPIATTRYLAPGQLVASADRCVLKTVLGSCVSVCLYDPSLRVGGMNHFLLPDAAGESSSFRYARPALDGLLAAVEELGGTARRMQACVFGGARVLPGISDLMHLGERNVEFAFAWLMERRIPAVTRDVLGSLARRVEFHLADGSSHVRVLGGA
jgi:chemotaxis protein CheD